MSFDVKKKAFACGVMSVVLMSLQPVKPANAGLLDTLRDINREVRRVEATVDKYRDIVNTGRDIVGTLNRTQREANDMVSELDYLFGGPRKEMARKVGLFSSYRDMLRNFSFSDPYQRQMLDLAKEHFDYLLFAARATYDGYHDMNPFDQGRDRGDSNTNLAYSAMVVSRMDTLTFAEGQRRFRSPAARSKAENAKRQSMKVENVLTTDLFSIFGNNFKDLPPSRKLIINADDLGTRYCSMTWAVPYVDMFFEDFEQNMLTYAAKPAPQTDKLAKLAPRTPKVRMFRQQNRE